METRIIGAIIPAMALLFAAVFAYLWRKDRTRIHLLGFSAGFALLVVSMGINLVLRGFENEVSVPIIHVLACLSVIVIIWAAAHRLGQPSPFVAMGAVTVSSCALLWASFVYGNPTLTVLAQNSASGMLFAIGAVLLWGARPRTALDRSLVWLMGLLASLGILRPAVALLAEGELSGLLGRTSIFHSINVLMIAILSVMLAVTLLLIALTDDWDKQRKVTRSDRVSGLRKSQVHHADCDSALARSSQLGIPASLILVEIDRFDAIASGWGEEVGEVFVRKIGDLIRENVRDGDLTGRVCDHRFAILVTSASLHSAAKLAKTLRYDVAHQLGADGSASLKITVSCGVVQHRTGESYADLQARGIASLEKAALSGHNRVFTEGDELECEDRFHAENEAISVLG